MNEISTNPPHVQNDFAKAPPGNYGEEGYLSLLEYILDYGTDKTDRTGVGTRSLFGAQLRFNLKAGFPLLTTKKIYTKGVFAELAWLIQGKTNVAWLQERDVHIWDEWADANGDLGPVYGAQWRYWGGDQLAKALELIKNSPDSRRILVSAWNASDLDQMALMPCHVMYQFEVHDGKLSCHMYQRSADIFLGVPFNIASYAGLTHYMAHLAGLRVGELIISFGDIHIYNNHFAQVDLQLSRETLPLSELKINPHIKSLSDPIDYDDFEVLNYQHHSAIKAPVAV